VQNTLPCCKAERAVFNSTAFAGVRLAFFVLPTIANVPDFTREPLPQTVQDSLKISDDWSAGERDRKDGSAESSGSFEWRPSRETGRRNTSLLSPTDQGFGVPKNPAESVKWCRKAAGSGFPHAQRALAHCYRLGKGVHADEAQFLKWLQLAALQGEPTAECEMGLAYLHGQGVTKQPEEALKWFRRSAKHGLPAGQNSLGAAYQNALAVERDFIEAYKWYWLAAAQGDETAQANLPKLARRMTLDQIVEAKKRAETFKPKKPPTQAGRSL
jgi:TPR repeat protein